VLLFTVTRLWRDVTAKLKLHNVEEATEHKHRIEQRQRDDAKRRLENGETWDTRVTMPVAACQMFINILLCSTVCLKSVIGSQNNVRHLSEKMQFLGFLFCHVVQQN